MEPNKAKDYAKVCRRAANVLDTAAKEILTDPLVVGKVGQDVVELRRLAEELELVETKEAANVLSREYRGPGRGGD